MTPSSPAVDPAIDMQALLRHAMQLHHDGQHGAAEAAYERVLEAEPAMADALHLFGVLHAQRGQHERAAQLIRQAIDQAPQESMFHNNLGNVLIEQQRFEEAEAAYRQAVSLDPRRIDALNNLGVLLSRQGKPAEAEGALVRAIELAPGFEHARQNLAHHFLRNNRLAEAVDVCCSGNVVVPRFTGLSGVLGMAYTMLGKKQEALAVYRHWAEAEPDNPRPRHYLAAVTGENVPDRASDDFVKGVFDDFADSFDAKLAALSYKAPEWVAAAVARHVGPPQGALHILDAGCGTGLCAPLLAPYAGRLVGVDLSQGMLRKAQARGHYHDLYAADLVAFIRQQPAALDVVVSADTLCYFGALEAFASAVAMALTPGGLLVFTVESHADDAGMPGFRLHEHGRYSHRRSYVESALAAAALDTVEMQAVVLRTEAHEPVHGWVVCARPVAAPKHQ